MCFCQKYHATTGFVFRKIAKHSSRRYLLNAAVRVFFSTKLTLEVPHLHITISIQDLSALHSTCLFAILTASLGCESTRHHMHVCIMHEMVFSSDQLFLIREWRIVVFASAGSVGPLTGTLRKPSLVKKCCFVAHTIHDEIDASEHFGGGRVTACPTRFNFTPNHGVNLFDLL